MAPIRPTSRRRTVTTKSQRERIPRPIKSTESAFASSKKDKRIIKHSSFVKKIQTQNSRSRKKRRRPSKKLATTLESLAEALPETAQEFITEDAKVSYEWANTRRKALTSRPGLQKRKEKIDKAERDRFSQNLAQIIGSQTMAPATIVNPPNDTTTRPVNRWNVLREFVMQNMEQKS